MRRQLNKINFGAKRVRDRFRNMIYNMNISRHGDAYLIRKAQKRFEKRLGRTFDWNNPRTLNEIVTTNKILSDTTLWSKLADKYEVREFIKAKGLESTLVDLYGVWDDAKEIDFSQLPTSFVLKSTNGCAKVMIVKDKSTLDIEALRDKLGSWLHNRFGYDSVEPHYLRIKPRIIAERLLTPSQDDSYQTNSLIDYKWYCFNGHVSYVFVASNRTHAHTYEMAMYDTEWVDHSHFVNKGRKKIGLVPKPKRLDEMIRICQVLSEGIPFVRIDLYEVDGAIYFGEMTFTPAAGYSVIQVEEFDRLMGETYRKWNP